MFRQAVDGGGSFHKPADVAFVTRHEHREGREHTFGRLLFVDGLEHLRVGDDEFRWAGKCFQGLRKLVGGAAHDEAFLVEQLPHCLHLGKDKPSLRSLDVLRHHEQYQIVFADPIARDGRLFKVLRKFLQDGQAEVFHSLSCLGAGQ